MGESTSDARAEARERPEGAKAFAPGSDQALERRPSRDQRDGLPRPIANPWVAALLAWLLPGAGHWYLGRRGRALAFLALAAVSIALGCALDGNLYRPLPNQPLTYLATLGCMGMGVPYFLLRYLAGYGGDVISPGYEYGTAFILTAGLMNMLLVLDAWDIAWGKKD